jgi:hypothetical protein
VKLDEHNNPIRFKSRCVARGFSQEYGVNYTETFQPVARLESVRAFIANAVRNQRVLYQCDFEGAYLQGDADHKMYMTLPKELKDLGLGIEDNEVLLLNKSLYGLKQAGYVWWQTIQNQLAKHSFKPTDAEPCLFRHRKDGLEIDIIMHVDDMLITTNDEKRMKELFAKVNTVLKHTINDKPANWYLGIKIEQEIANGKLQSCTLSQPAFVEQLCKGNGVVPPKRSRVCVPCTPTKLSRRDCPDDPSPDVVKGQVKFRSNVGAILFLARCTRPDIAFAVGRLGRFASNSGPPHWAEMTHLLRYLSNTPNMGLKYSQQGENTPICSTSNWNKYSSGYYQAYTDSDFAGCPDTSRSTSGNVITWMGAAICWSSALQACVTLSTAEAEMVALSKAAQEAIWFRRLMQELRGPVTDSQGNEIPIEIHCDNQATLGLVKNRIHHSRTKHISLRENFVRERADEKEIAPVKIATDLNISDGMTKPLPKQKVADHAPKLHGMPLQFTAPGGG